MDNQGVRCIAVMAVGGSEFTGWAEKPTKTLPGGPQTDSDAVAQTLKGASHQELVGLARSLRHIRSLEELSRSYPGQFDLLLIGTRQPDTVPEDLRRGDTFQLAEQVRRAVVAASTDGVLACREARIVQVSVADVNEPTEQLADALESVFDGILADPPPALERLIFIQPGGTPAIRLLLERAVSAAARRLGVPAEMRWTSPRAEDPRPIGLLRVIEADIVERNAAQRIIDAVRGARYVGAVVLADDLPVSVRKPVAKLLELGAAVTTRKDVRLALDEAQQTIPTHLYQRWRSALTPTRRANIEARIGLVRGAEHDGRFEDALITFTTVTELLPGLLAETLAPQVLGRPPKPADLMPAEAKRVVGRLIERGGPRDLADATRWAAVCAAWRPPRMHALCDICSARLPLVEAMAEADRAFIAVALREDERGKPSTIALLRHEVVHRAVQAPPESEIREAIEAQWDILGRQGSEAPTSLADLLGWAVTELLGSPPADPLAGIEAEIERLLASAGLVAPPVSHPERTGRSA